MLALPVVGSVAAVGILMGVAQTLFQIQDQNVAFAPKLATVAGLAAAAGPAAFGLLVSLLVRTIELLPHIARL